MRVFAKVVENSSFAGAAARLDISASMVTLHVKELEERLGVRLLNRTTRKVSLTETGRAYYERCTRLLADLEETEQAVSDMHTAPRGELRVNATPGFGILELAVATENYIRAGAHAAMGYLIAVTAPIRWPADSRKSRPSHRFAQDSPLEERGFELLVPP